MKVLIVDDKQENLYLLESLLRASGYQTISARNGAEALGLARKDKPDLIITDILMPLMDGYTLCRECKKDDSLNMVPIIFYTATYTDPKDEEFALSLGADRFVLKPLDPDAFLEIVESLLKDVKKNKIQPVIDALSSETVILKEYNEVLIRKLEDKMRQTEENEKKLKNYVKELEESLEERKKVEIALRESEKKYRTLITQSPDGIFVVDLKGKFLSVNESVCKELKFTEEEFLSMNIWDLVPEKFKEQFQNRLMNLVNGSIKNEPMEYEIKGKDGILHVVEVLSVPYYRENELIGFQGIARNITERKRTEEALQQNQKQLTSIYNTVGDVIIYLSVEQNQQYRFISVNPAFTKVTGVPVEQVVGKLVSEVIPEPSLSMVLEKYRTAINEKITIHWEETSVFPSGKLIGEVSIAPVFDKVGKCTHLVGTVHDITDRKRVEEEIRLLAHSIASISECISITDNDDTIIFVNEAFTDTYGYTRDELMGKHVSFLRPPQANAELGDNILKRTIVGGWKGEVLNKKKDGTIFPIQLSTSVIKDTNGNPLALIGVATDITEEKRAREELIRTKEKAEEMSRLKSNFLANMSHELRTPLNGILGYSEILISELQDTDNLELITGIYNSGRRLSTTLNLILDLTKAETDKIEVSSKPGDLVQIAALICKSFHNAALKKNLTCEIRVLEEKIYANIDERLFSQILNYLVDNAIKFTDKGSITLEFGKEISDNKEWAFVKVIDTGIGIPADKINLIWDEFRQVSEGISRSYEGAGLGLTIAKKTTELMNGIISCESEPNKGSVFTVKFPAIAVEEESKKESLPSIQKTKKEKTPSVLVVEDDEINRNIIRLFLLNHYKVDTAVDVNSALKLIKGKKYDALLLDINLGEQLNGMDLLKEILALPQYVGTPIIAVTAYALETDKQKFYSAGFTHHIAKPFFKAEIIQFVENAINKTST